ncbi:glycoside hydrolase family 3 N-terminal domain-containing protein [Streptococcus respiraculi]|uniref:glycoside hydrolase family 3 N-terminal domain-containing protein n=1 Tax=Streptococcus respiraculi TaxID=2021971 RepID=UPI0013C4293C|nr:glycoside hydrolase family 3 N-terminal domain-containing protein [Streptococcus respiraculi]
MKKRTKKQRGKLYKAAMTILSALVSLILIGVIIVTNTILPNFSKMGNMILNGYSQTIDNSKIKAEGLDLEYNPNTYTAETIKEAERQLYDEISAEGLVLLKNTDKTLPFSKGTTFSFVSANSKDFKINTSLLGSSSTGDLKESFEKEGFLVNKTLWDFYKKGAGKKYGLAKGSIDFGDAEDFRINEAPLTLLEENGVLDSLTDTVPVFVLSRVAGEGRDMPRSMYQHADKEEDKVKSYLQLDSTETEIIKYLNEHFKEVVILVKSNAALDLSWVEQYPNIKGVVYSQGTAEATAKVFAGEVNPSGRLVDTFASNALASPAAQNFGSYQYYDEEGNPTKYNYISYAEGIYVGYKYYETRYEDVVLKQGNAGDFDYKKEVVYPFGYGLSYTDFKWSNYQLTDQKDTITATIEVTNTGDVAGKDVVELYLQSPYTNYDKENKVEKSSVSLVGYAKTKNLAPGETEKVSVTFNKEQLKSYDYTNAKTYILDAGDYYVTIARNANGATNNILSKKGKTTADGMTEAGNPDLVGVYSPDNVEVDITTYAKDNYSGHKITNLFDRAHGSVKYLSRQDWLGTFPKHDGEPSAELSTWGNEINGVDKDGKPTSYTWYKVAGKDLIHELDSTDSGNPVDKGTISVDIVYNQDNGLQLIDLRGLDFDDVKWEKLLDQLSPEDYYTLLTDSGYGTEPIHSIDKPFSIDADTAAGLIYGGTGFMFPNTMVLAQTWNTDLAKRFGEMIGEQANIGGASGWYAPSMNLHRTPFSGRNGEYYSEDALLSGTVGSLSMQGAASKGMYTFIKHFALNDQENHRGDRTGQFGLATWTNEQAIRELYLLPFEMSMKAKDIPLNYIKQNQDGTFENATKNIRSAQAVMTAFNRIGSTWTGGSYPLINGILRDEWDFDGFVITDNANTGVFMDTYQMIEAGADAKLLNAKDPTNYTFDAEDPATYYYARNAVHRLLYTIVNSKSVEGAMSGSQFKQGIHVITKIRVGLTGISVALISLMGWFTYRRFHKPVAKKKEVA